MKNIKIIVLMLMLSGISALMITCKHEIPGIIPGGNGNGNGNPTQSDNCSPDTVYFVNEISPIINANCASSGCHDAITRKEGVELTSYSKIMGYVKPFNPGDSKLYESCVKAGSERMPPPPLPALTSSQLSKIIKWINQGALNNQCNGGCDSAIFTYSGAVSITINTFCIGCHNPVSPGGSIDLSTYAAVKTQALNGRLMGSISHAAGYSAMPKGINKLSECQVLQVEKWIKAGTPNN